MLVAMLCQAGVHDHPLPADSGSFFENLFKVYVPRQQCMYNEASVIWIHVVSDVLIAMAYFSIPIALVYFIRRRRDFTFGWIFAMFAAFILLCGTTHVFGAWAIWQPLYKIEGLVKLTTGLVSIATAIYLWKLMPVALALPSPEQLRAANTKLEGEIVERRKAEASQALLQAELEERVSARTRELAERNESLHRENAARVEAERERNALLASERSARRDAERANRTKDEFLATLSHELRTPLNAIQGWAQLLRRGDVERKEFEQGLEVIERNARIQTGLIEDLLDMSRILSGKLRLDVAAVDLPQVIQAAIDSIAPAAAAKEIRVQTVLDPRAGPVSGDAGRLQQVVWNLLSNAVKFTPKGGVVQVTLERVRSQVEVRISDTGIGIAPEFMPQLFERFSQGDPTTTRSGGGLGLGLSIVRHLVELHGGAVSAHSDGRAKGSTFVVSLPLLTHAEVSRPVDPAIAAGPRAPAGLSGVRVLVVDDEPDARHVIRRILEVCGAEVDVAESAEQGLLRIAERRPNVIVSDLAMPVVDGYAFLRRVRELPVENGGRIPAVALTALASSDDRRRALVAGFQMHIVKPVDPDELVAVVASVLGRFGSSNESGG
jgi:signal transduction histidine kinase/ActR/RegA family two-component response regulator